MALRDILVHMDDHESCKARLAAAVGIATKHNAHLTGLFVMPSAAIPGYMDVQIPLDLIQMHEDRMKEIAQSVEKLFEQATQSSDLSSEWRCLQGYAPDIIADHGHYSDLIVIGQHDPAVNLGARNDEIPDHVVLSSGRPVLIVPNNFSGGEIGNRVLVGWDRGQMATRALHDALPVLQKADAVSIMMVNPKPRPGDSGHSPGADVARHLARHGVSVEADHIVNEKISICDQLLSRAADMGADLIVSGAYGHSRWREIMLGGVTRELLDTMPYPLLMSH